MSMITIIMLIIYIVCLGGLSIFLLVKSAKDSALELVKGDNDNCFSSRIGFVFSIIGISIGIGAMYKFPMMCVRWGGGTFVLAFIVACAVIVIPIGRIALALGRQANESEVGTLTKFAKTPGTVLGWFISIDQMFFLGYYPSVIAIGVIYLFKSITGIHWIDNTEATSVSTSNNKILMLLVIVGLLIIIGIISGKGVNKGIEKCCKFMVPAVFVILVIIGIRILFIPEIASGIEYYLKPNWSELSNPEMWSAAVGTALFAMGLGPGCLIAYGSYTNDSQDIAKDFVTANIVQIFIYIVAGFVIVPPMVALGMNPLELSSILNENVMFITLPKIFARISGGIVLMILFYTALVLTGITSSLSQMESGMSLLVDKSGGLGLSRKTAIIVEWIVAIIIAYYCTFNNCVYEVLGKIVVSLGYPLATLGLLILCGWVIGAKRIRQEWYNNPRSVIKWGTWMDLLCKYLLPIVMAWFAIKAFVSLF